MLEGLSVLCSDVEVQATRLDDINETIDFSVHELNGFKEDCNETSIKIKVFEVFNADCLMSLLS